MITLDVFEMEGHVDLALYMPCLERWTICICITGKQKYNDIRSIQYKRYKAFLYLRMLLPTISGKASAPFHISASANFLPIRHPRPI
jgi:hypothetical protein